VGGPVGVLEGLRLGPLEGLDVGNPDGMNVGAFVVIGVTHGQRCSVSN